MDKIDKELEEEKERFNIQKENSRLTIEESIDEQIEKTDMLGEERQIRVYNKR